MSPRQLWAKSPPRGRTVGELLTTHLAASLEAMSELHRRVGHVAALPERFWTWARLSVLLHDAGKVAEGFQSMVGNGSGPAQPWGERHEVYSLGFVARVLADSERDDRLWVSTGVAAHHRPFTGDPDARVMPLFCCYDEVDPAAFAARFGATDPDLVGELAEWLSVTARAHDLLPTPSGQTPPRSSLGEDALQLFEELRERW